MFRHSIAQMRGTIWSVICEFSVCFMYFTFIIAMLYVLYCVILLWSSICFLYCRVGTWSACFPPGDDNHLLYEHPVALVEVLPTYNKWHILVLHYLPPTSKPRCIFVIHLVLKDIPASGHASKALIQYKYHLARYRDSNYKSKTAMKLSGPHLNIKTIFPRYGDSHVKDKTVGEIVLS